MDYLKYSYDEFLSDFSLHLNYYPIPVLDVVTCCRVHVSSSHRFWYNDDSQRIDDVVKSEISEANWNNH